ncbi:MAG: translation initiation factor IF-2 [Pseudomonadota bacterium]|nr:translation initiation factor IF-2 [Pseudomonadota bacterium]
MTETKQTGDKKTLSVSRGSGRIELKVRDGGSRSNVGSGRGAKTVQVEVRKKRSPGARREDAPATEVVREQLTPQQRDARRDRPAADRPAPPRDQQQQKPRRDEQKRPVDQTRGRIVLPRLTDEEKSARQQALFNAKALEAEKARQAELDAKRRALEEERRKREEAEQARIAAEEEAKRKAEDDARLKVEEEARRRQEMEARKAEAQAARSEAPKADADGARGERPAAPADRGGVSRPAGARPGLPAARAGDEPDAEEGDSDARARKGGGRGGAPAPVPAKVPSRTKPGGDRRRGGKLTISQALDDSGGERQKSLAALRRRQQRAHRSSSQGGADAAGRVVRDVIVPEALTVGELANRMAVRGGEVVKALMKMGVMATINQVIDADTAELVVEEFGHRIRRVAESDVETAIAVSVDEAGDTQSRPAVVTVMGHVDHGKTSVLDALRHADVVSREAGGITQHIGAYQITTDGGQRITFIDTPGHAAFTSMRARGARVTDLVVLVVAADDSVMPQTVEAINHAKAAGVPIIVACNKIDKPGARPEKVKQDLLQHGIVVEDMGGEVLCVDISALKGTNLDKLLDAILLQAELLELKANPDRSANGTVIEAKLEQGRGAVATVLIQGGTLKIGDIFVCGATWGRVRALINDQGERIEAAGPSLPIEVLGFQDAPEAGDEFVVVETEGKAREVADFRARRTRDQIAAAGARGTLEQMLSAIKEGQAAEVPIIVKGDVQGSVEAIVTAADKLSTSEVKARVLHAGVGGITETDVTLAKSTGAVIFGFNARPNRQAREAAERDGVDIRYYNIIYQLTDELKAMMSGKLDPEIREKHLGEAEVRMVFQITKVGKVAGCLVQEGVVRRNALFRQTRDGIVLHEGKIATLKHFKEDVSEARAGTECGMSFANHQDIQEGDLIEVFEQEKVARSL